MAKYDLEQQFLKEYNRLNPNQKLAVDTVEGPVIVNAGPGSGKTQILALRIANILRKTDTNSRNILCLTFTDSAAANMKERLYKMIGAEYTKLNIFTFHSFATDIIAKNPSSFFGGNSFTPMDPITGNQILNAIFDIIPYGNPLFGKYQDSYTYIKDTKSQISNLKKAGISPMEFKAQLVELQEFYIRINQLLGFFGGRVTAKMYNNIQQLVTEINEIDTPTPISSPSYQYKKLLLETLSPLLVESANDKPSTKPLTEWKKRFIISLSETEIVLNDTQIIGKNLAVADIYQSYQNKLWELGFFDFEDMLVEVCKTLADENNFWLKSFLQEQYQYILIDEFQDTNGIQLKLVNYVIDSGLENPNIMIVGDPDQAIFKFQGAGLTNLSQFNLKYPKAEIINLVDNYRSHQAILDLAHGLIENSGQRLGNCQKLTSRVD
ncbi:MAG: ATP-dependent helicase [Candidatus Parcubacteria bacterium]|nr:ATP-dependent helicase [Candidatus Paceibacterota bacterium]